MTCQQPDGLTKEQLLRAADYIEQCVKDGVDVSAWSHSYEAAGRL